MSLQNNRHSEFEITKSYEEIICCLDDYLLSIIDNVLCIIKDSLVNGINNPAGENARLLGYDENVYENYKKIIEDYDEILLYYENNKKDIQSQTINELLAGMCSVLSLQANQFKEANQNTAENPMSVEAKNISKEFSDLLKELFDASTSETKKDVIESLKELSENLVFSKCDVSVGLELTNAAINLIMEIILPDIYIIYDNTCKKCFASLNDVNLREKANFYYDIFKKEYDILNSIIIIQVKAIEDKIKLFEQEETQGKAGFFILSKIRETYQRYMKSLAALYFNMHESKTSQIQVEPYEEFYDKIRGLLIGDIIFSVTSLNDVKNKLSAFFDNMQSHLKVRINELLRNQDKDYSLDKNLYLFRKKISEATTLANDLYSSFEKINEYYTSNEALFENLKGADIIAGIYDTIKIKLESISENKEAFIQTFEDNLSRFVSGYPELSDEKLYETSEYIFHELGNKKLEEISFADMLESFPSFKLYLEQLVLYINSHSEKISKKILGYKKDYLLYEVSTYEEIINYSVSKLKESDDSLVLEFVSICEGVYNELFIIMKKNNISIISPQPHEMFKAKLHEVLTAEKNELFKKGEIIKVLNSGFKQDDTVISRANVIAAR